jgi:hypothetical protein
MSHVNAIKSGAIVDKHARAASNASYNNTASVYHDSGSSSGGFAGRRRFDSTGGVRGVAGSMLDTHHRMQLKEPHYAANYLSKNSRFYPVVKEAKPVEPGTPRKRKTRHSTNPPVESHVGWVLDNSQDVNATSASNTSLTNGGGGVGGGSRISNGFVAGATPHEETLGGGGGNLSSSFAQSQDLVPFQHPSYSLLQQNGFTQQLYGKFRKRCLAG